MWLCVFSKNNADKSPKVAGAGRQEVVHESFPETHAWIQQDSKVSCNMEKKNTSYHLLLTFSKILTLHCLLKENTTPFSKLWGLMGT